MDKHHFWKNPYLYTTSPSPFLGTFHNTNTMLKTNYFIITGGPGMGKTSLLDALQQQGYTCIPETGRTIIQHQVTTGGNALPWADRSAFARLMFRQSVADYEAQRPSGQPVFFDRGIPDVQGYLALCGLPVPPDVAAACRDLRYNSLVFMTPPWKEIYENDRERKQSFEEAVRTFDMMQETYSSLGYQLEILPKSSVAERVRHVLSCALTRC